MCSPPSIAAVALGDSITQGIEWFSIANAAAGNKYTLAYNAGVGGDTTAGMLSRVNTDVVSRAPKLATLLGGTNDIGQDISSSVIISNLDAILSIYAANNIRAILGTIPPRCSTVTFDPLTAPQKANFLAVNDWIRSKNNGTTVKVADWTQVLSNGGDGTFPNLSLFSDHVHPNTAGKTVMAGVLQPLL